MPAYHKADSAETKKTHSYLDATTPEDQSAVAEQERPSRAGKRKTKNAVAKRLHDFDNADKTAVAKQMDEHPSASPPQPRSLLGQLELNQGFTRHGRDDTLNNLNDLNSTRKVSDDYALPADAWPRQTSYGKSPTDEPYSGLNAPPAPSYEPGFSARGGFQARSPPVSPPSRKARPISYGGGMPAMPAMPSHSRMSTSPYAYGMSPYGSPPALPHLPQQHFYGPHDVDLGLAKATAHMHLSQPSTVKFSSIPGVGHERSRAVFMMGDGNLDILSYNGEKVDHIGSLRGVEGTILDACFLTWSADEDPFAGYRPLVAITVHGPSNVGFDTSTPDALSVHDGQEAILETKVIVYSLRKACHIAELLRVPAPLPPFPGGFPNSGPIATLKLHASGNFMVVSCGSSGEVFVFSVRKCQEAGAFVCLGKYWTTLQPQIQRRDSSYGPSSEPEISPADLGRAQESDDAPILSLNGRWLAFCPASASSRRSVGAILGRSVIHTKNSTITSGTAPPKPVVSCEVESPDADTFLGKVAKGFAQEAVRSAKWISEKGFQTWHNYWKKDTTNNQQSPAVAPSSPPMYSPRPNFAQFPPTHGPDQQDASKDPEVITVLDLRLLQENHSKKGVDFTPLATFQPPGGCSFLSFMPNGLCLFTASRKGDVQYVWDLMQLKYLRSSAALSASETGRVRQIARYERLSPSTIVDLAWDGPTGPRFALLTKNRTVHIFDLPRTAFQWPPPRPKEHRPTSAPANQPNVTIEHEAVPPGRFLASAMSLAGKTQPMLANLRGRAPSINGGLSSIGASGFGLASATGIKSGRAVAAGLSKSLGAATETVTSLRHANQSRLSLKTAVRADMLCWQERDGKSVLSVLDSASIRNYHVRMTKPRENRQKDTVSVFDARKAVACKLPKTADLLSDTGLPNEESNSLSAFWRFRAGRDGPAKTPHPLAFAEIETNAPYQPFHSDRRVAICLLREDNFASSSQTTPWRTSTPGWANAVSGSDAWVFGTDIQSRKLNITGCSDQVQGERSVIYRETTMAPQVNTLGQVSGEVLDNSVSHIISSTKKRKSKRARIPTQIFDDEETVGIGLDATRPQGSLDPDFDLLETESSLR
ncbi:hypothetical protein ABEF93_003288 [Exophiala dermatitidis]